MNGIGMSLERWRSELSAQLYKPMVIGVRVRMFRRKSGPGRLRLRFELWDMLGRVVDDVPKLSIRRVAR